MSQSILKKLLFLSLPLLFFTGCNSLKYRKKCCKLWRAAAGHAAVKPINEKSKLSGKVHFESLKKKKIQVKALVTGLKPNQSFGFHIHEFGDCGNKALQAGGHFNPWRHKHGGPKDEKKHLGDMGNLKSDKEGKAVYSVVLHGPLKAFLGRSVIIHEKADDLKSQPTGNSGGRIGCGVIGRVMSFGVSHKHHDHKAHRKSQKSQPVNKVAPKAAAVKSTKKDKTEKAKAAPKAQEKPAAKPTAKPVQKDKTEKAKATTKTQEKAPAKAAVKPAPKTPAKAAVKPTTKAPKKEVVKPVKKEKAEKDKTATKTQEKAPVIKKAVKKPVSKTKVKATEAKKTSSTKKESVKVTTKVVVEKAETKSQSSPSKTEKTAKTAPKAEKASK